MIVSITHKRFAGTIVAPDPVVVWDAHRKKLRKVTPVLTLAHADTPARAKWALTCGHASRTGCDKCGLRSCRTLADGTPVNYAVYRGYIAPAPACTLEESAAGADNPVEWVVGQVRYGARGKFNVETAQALLISDRKHTMRSLAAEAANAAEAELHPLPVAAANGGCLASDPNSPEQRALSKRGSSVLGLG
jgi:hypothetical protein